ncbi:MAG: DUF5681 domain-containing protein [Sphingobium sp.]
MSDGHDDEPPPMAGRRKDGKPFKEGNIRADGSYMVGRNRPPPGSQFRKGDGRERGKRPKGVRNADTEFERELKRKIVIREDGKERKVTKGHAVDVRLIDNATRGGQNRAIELVDQRRQRITARKEEAARHYHSLSDMEILERYLRERAEELKIDPDLFGDPDASEGVCDD